MVNIVIENINDAIKIYMLEKLPEKERIKSKKTIEELFAKGRHLNAFPIKILYLESNNLEITTVNKAGFGVSKKKFKLAVKRNLIKRRMREAYRKNKPLFLENHLFMIIFMSNKIEPYQVIETKIKECFLKFKEPKNI